MDAYDHIQEEVLATDDTANREGDHHAASNLNTEFQEAYKSFSASPWGAKLGGFFGNVKKQGESYYEGARQEATAASGEALKGFTDLKSTIVNRARSLSTNQSPPPTPSATPKVLERDTLTTAPASKERSESEVLRDSESIISRFRTEATKRLKEIEKAEDAADEALFKFGANIRNFLRDAVTIAPPSEDAPKDGTPKVLFESKDQDGKRVIHTTRFDAQLHAIHSSPDSFTKDPPSAEYEKWKAGFSVENQTNAIATDLDNHEELRRAMEKLVPEVVEYAQFWTRYYFLRMVVETEEQRRRDLLKGAASTTALSEQIAWDEDSDSEPSTPHQPQHQPLAPANPKNPSSPSSTKTLTPTTTPANSTTPATTTSEPRRSQDQHSQPDSDASYDLVSGATSRAPGSPKVEEKRVREKRKGDESEEEDWE